jgi:hypothetical protein
LLAICAADRVAAVGAALDRALGEHHDEVTTLEVHPVLEGPLVESL